MKEIGESYTTEILKAAIAQSTLDKVQINTILSANITCPGVTSKEVAKQLPGVLNEALEREFSGLHLQAMQWT